MDRGGVEGPAGTANAAPLYWKVRRCRTTFRSYVRNYKSLAISRLCARHNTTWGYTMKQDKLKPFTDDLHP